MKAVAGIITGVISLGAIAGTAIAANTKKGKEVRSQIAESLRKKAVKIETPIAEGTPPAVE